MMEPAHGLDGSDGLRRITPLELDARQKPSGMTMKGYVIPACFLRESTLPVVIPEVCNRESIVVFSPVETKIEETNVV